MNYDRNNRFYRICPFDDELKKGARERRNTANRRTLGRSRA
jgi:hypothetical protein